ncbi:hypothetical protein DV737_g3321, partial [Chaetothyriales sp. CBS 132003]
MLPEAPLSASPPPAPVATLQARADALRAALKDYERAFAAQHHGRKPAKEDIKADGEVAAKYREYNKVREVIAGKAKTDGERVATPQQPRGQKEQGDLLQHLGATPATGSRAKHSRTPISEGRKFMLSQFFATPSTVRYQQILHTGETPERMGMGMVKTPPKKGGNGEEAEEGRANDETPKYLRRTASFKDRLLSASSSSPSSMPGRSGMADHEGRSSTGAGLVKVKAKAKFQPKPLSQIAAELLKQRPGETQQAGKASVDADDDDEDGMEALRELEDAEMNKPAKSKAAKGKGKKSNNKKTRDENENGTGGGEIRTYDPNAVSHMNFKSLKIKNKNSKGKFRGRGSSRFARARHR